MIQALRPVLLGQNGFSKVPQGGGRYSFQKAAVRTYFTHGTDCLTSHLTTDEVQISA